MPWILGAAMVLLAALGLTIAGKAVDGTMTWVGLFLCAFGVLFTYDLIVRYGGGGNKP